MRRSTGFFLLCALIIAPLWVAAEETAPESIRQLAIKWLKESTAFISCDDGHFIYGVGYIDGSYMERIFYVEGGGAKPILSVQFRDDDQIVLTEPGDFGPIPFVLEVRSPRTMYATLENGTWRLGDDSWETALRFKYTSWFGAVSRTAGLWGVEWQGYRRPMLPESVTERVEETCALFSER
jgi:hypothetical protein